MAKKRDSLMGVIDIGSHAVRLYIGQAIRKGKIKIIDNLWLPIAIGKDTFSRGSIGNNTISELIRILKNFKTALDTYKVSKVKAVATNALREASNSEILVERVNSSTGIKIDLLEPIEETNLICNAIRRQLKKYVDLENFNTFLFIVGAGSTQIVYLRKDNAVFTETFQIGTLRMQKVYALHHTSYKHYIERVSTKLINSIEAYKKEKGKVVKHFIVVNDDSLNIIRKLGIQKKGKNFCFYRTSKKTFIQIYKNITELSIQKMCKKFDLNENLAQTTLLSFILIGKFFELTKAEKIIFPEVNLASAILWKASTSKKGEKQELNEETHNDIINSSMAICEKFKADLGHSKRVKKLAVSIFEQLSSKFGFENKERLYLEVSSLLHDIGRFINFKDHHKHSETLISSCEILGLTTKEMNVISKIARYHREEIPKNTDEDFSRLSEKERIIVTRMAAILKISDSLDSIYPFTVNKVKVNITEDACEFYLKMDSYEHFDLLRMNVKNRADLFEKFYGLNVKVEKLIS